MLLCVLVIHFLKYNSSPAEKNRMKIRISTQFFVCVKNMSQCVKYQEPGEGVGVGFCHSCHSLKILQKHLDFFDKIVRIIDTTRRESLGHERVFFFGIYCLTQRRNREHDPECLWCMSVRVCVCAHMWMTCSHYARRAFLMTVHYLTFAQTSCWYMSSAKRSQVNLARFLVMILPAAENMCSGAAEGQVQRELSSPRGQSMESLKRRASTQSEGSCVTVMVAGASSTWRSPCCQCRNSTS